jgi:hypothetical protein
MYVCGAWACMHEYRSTDGGMEHWATGWCGRVTGLKRNMRHKEILETASTVHNTSYLAIADFRTNKNYN